MSGLYTGQLVIVAVTTKKLMSEVKFNEKLHDTTVALISWSCYNILITSKMRITLI